MSIFSNGGVVFVRVFRQARDARISVATSAKEVERWTKKAEEDRAQLEKMELQMSDLRLKHGDEKFEAMAAVHDAAKS